MVASNFGAAVAAFFHQNPLVSFVSRGLLGAREDGAAIRVVRALDALPPAELPSSVTVAGQRWPVICEAGEPVRLHAGSAEAMCVAPEAAAPRARAGALIECEVDEVRTFGTLGMSFIGRDGAAYLMSNWHVLCSQRSRVDHSRVLLGGREQPIARLHAFARVDADGINTWDLAVARYDQRAFAAGGFARLRSVPRGLPAPVAIAAPRMGETYFKVGASTAYREAQFAGVGAHAVALGDRAAGVRFARLSFFASRGSQRFSIDGDSGSVVVHARSGAASGLLLGGFVTATGSVSVASPIHEAFTVLGRVRTAEGEVLPRLDYPWGKRARGLEWVRV